MKKRIVLSILLTIAIIASGSLQIFAQTPPAVDDDYYSCAVYKNGSYSGETAYTIKGNLYFDVNTLKKFADTSRFTVDTDKSEICFDIKDFSIYVGDLETSAFIKENAGVMSLPLKKIYDGYYVSFGSIAKLLGLEYEYDNFRINVTESENNKNYGMVKAASASAASLDGDFTMSSGEIAFVTGETNAFYQIKTLTGETAYVNKTEFERAGADAVKYDYIANKNVPKNFKDQKINLVWFAGGTRTKLCPEDRGIDVISPVWFNLVTDAEGSLMNYCDYGFVELAHQNGYEVWACSNDFGLCSSSYTAQILADSEMSDKAIAQYLMYASLYDLDGINIDYESIYYYKDNYNNFAAHMSTLSKYCKKTGLALSVDTATPLAVNQKYFDFETLGRVCDYVIPMTYDEHYAKSTTPGSASTKPWYTKMINILKDFVPQEKILMGVPLYGISWVMNPDGSINYMNTLTMTTQRARITENNVTPQWLSDAEQYYAEYIAPDGFGRKMWIENARSIACRCKSVFDLGIAGTACWRYDEAEDGIFDVFYGMFREGSSVSAYEKAY